MPAATQKLKKNPRTIFATKILSSSPVDLSAFRATLRKRPKSPHCDALKALADAKRGSVLEVESLVAYNSFVKAASRLGYELHYAEHGEKMLIQIMGTGSDK